MPARIDGVGYNVQTTNTTDVEFTWLDKGEGGCPNESWVDSCWSHDGFEIGYEDSLQGSWELQIPATLWIHPILTAP